jgi:hypothetical protein
MVARHSGRVSRSLSLAEGQKQMLEFGHFIVEFCKALAWPAAAVIIAFTFRADLKAMVQRVTKLGPQGVEFDPGRQLARTSQIDAPPTEVYGRPPSPAVKQIEDHLRGAIKDIEEDKRFDVAMRELAISRLTNHFEGVYRSIFGSQISALIALNQAPDGAVSKEEAVQFFENNAQAKFPDFYRNASFETWVQFLLSNFLAEFDGHKYKITPIGREFINFMRHGGFPEAKPG